MINQAVLSKIHSVQNTQKITQAMQMVSAAKMRKTQEQIHRARPYADKARSVMAHFSLANTTISLPLLRVPKKLSHVGIILMTTDKGLCGPLNTNVIKVFFNQVKQFQEKYIRVSVCCFGLKGLVACKKANLEIVASAVQIQDTPKMEDLIGPVTKILQRYEEKELDAIYLINSHFINAMKYLPNFEQILPLTSNHTETSPTHRFDYLYEPDALSVLNLLIKRYIESLIYQAVAENMASEQAARMVSMKAATDNADQILKNLRLAYNRARQAMITTELSEIMAGAAAV